MSPNELVSIVANNTGDQGFNLITREEYLGFMNNVAQDLWFKSKALHVLREYDLSPGAANVSPDGTYFDFPEDDIIEFALLEVKNIATLGGIEPSILQPGSTSVFMQEKPPVKNVVEGQGVFQNVGNIYPHYYLTPEFRDGRYRLQTIRPFRAGDVLLAYCVIHGANFTWVAAIDNIDPFNPNTIPPRLNPPSSNDVSRIWEPLTNLFIEGMNWRAWRRKSQYPGNENCKVDMRESKDLYYNQLLPQAIHYIHSLHEASSVHHVAPFQYLNER